MKTKGVAFTRTPKKKKKIETVKDFVHIFIYIFQRDPCLTMFGTICLKTKRIAAEKKKKKKKTMRTKEKGPTLDCVATCKRWSRLVAKKKKKMFLWLVAAVRNIEEEFFFFQNSEDTVRQKIKRV